MKRGLELEGKAPAKLAALLDGSVVVAQADAPPRRVIGCACGQVVMDVETVGNYHWPVVEGIEHRYSLPCRPRLHAPTRAGREGDQALPAPGVESVFAEVRRRLDERESVGVRRYGASLQTFNGRDACRDLEDELLDGLAYATQLRLEHRAVVEALLVLAGFAEGQSDIGLTPSQRAAVELARKLRSARREG
jgi:hypothetical protein